jgi:thiol-disulfide isomerase/thioredoxin
MSKLKQRVEFLANVAIVVVAVALCAVLVKQYFLAGPTTPAQQQPAVGAKIALPGIDLSSQDKTLLLVLQKGCHYCSESAPFYQRLAREAADKAGQVKVVAVLPQAVDEARSYLSGLGVPALDVRQAELGALSVGGTPTIIMVSRGTVTDVWVGKLDAAGESQVLSKL